MILRISAHCQDRFFAQLLNSSGSQIGEDYVGYVPNELLVLNSGGDSVELDIDLETGQILNWIKPNREALFDIFNTNDPVIG